MLCYQGKFEVGAAETKLVNSHSWRTFCALLRSSSFIKLYVCVFHWRIADLQCVVLHCIAGDLDFFSLLDYYKILSIVPCAIQSVLVCYLHLTVYL